MEGGAQEEMVKGRLYCSLQLKLNSNLETCKSQVDKARGNPSEVGPALSRAGSDDLGGMKSSWRSVPSHVS